MARHSEVIDGGDVAEQVPFPRSNTTSRDPSVFTNSGDVTPPVCATNAAGSATDVAPQEGIFMRCFSFLQNMGVSLIMPPYAADEELNNIISGELGNINLVSLHLARWSAVALVADTSLSRILLQRKFLSCNPSCVPMSLISVGP